MNGRVYAREFQSVAVKNRSDPVTKRATIDIYHFRKLFAASRIRNTPLVTNPDRMLKDKSPFPWSG
jgi:hypothetical protein